jgi:hypothetical protein
MIRDPSDGSVREGISPDANKINAIAPKSLSEEISGLREASPKDTYQARLKASREWFEGYQKRNAANARGNSSEQELSSERGAVEGERASES